MISINENFNDLEKELSGKIPCCLIPAIRKLPSNSEYFNVLVNVLRQYKGNDKFHTSLSLVEYNHLEIHLMAKGINHKLISGLRAAYVDKSSYYKALSIIYENAKNNCLKQ